METRRNCQWRIMTYFCKALTKSYQLPPLSSSKDQLLPNQCGCWIPASLTIHYENIPKNRSACSQEDFYTHFLPTMTRTASCIIVRARASIVSGNVALNNDRIIEGFEHALTIESITSTNPSSKSLSDSSKTRYSTLHLEFLCYCRTMCKKMVKQNYWFLCKQHTYRDD